MVTLDAAQLDRIGAEARQVDVGRVLATLFAALFFAVGWVPAQLVNAAVWAFVAARVGWRAARPPRPAAARSR